MDEEMLAEVVRLAIEGRSEAAIARVLKEDRKRVRAILKEAEARRWLTRTAGGGKGRVKRYDRGPASPSPRRGVLQPSQVPPEIMVAIRAHAWRFKLPVFEDELFYREPGGNRVQWRLGTWAGDYREYRLNAVSIFTFEESGGTWQFVRWAHDRDVRVPFTNRRRKRIGTVVLMPRPANLRPEDMDRAEEVAFDAALRLVRDISENRRLTLRGVPEQIRPTEFGLPIEEHESIPPGRVSIAKGVWVDRSRPGRLPEVETTDALTARRLALSLNALAIAPDLPDRLAAAELAIAALRRELDDLKARPVKGP